MKRLIIIYIFFLPLFSLYAQKASVSHASFYHWSGGVCCRTGTHYSFSFKITGDTSQIMPDTIYVDGHGFPLTSGVIQRTCGTKKCEFTAGLQHITDERTRVPDPHSQNSPALYSYPVFDGKALLVYHVNGKRKTLVIKKMEQGPDAHYP